ncbi:PGF-CTERM sorting domain-containing protein [Halarchaeum grantii]|uniref:PGF-CTERM sorting domain-containing protein n=1 Tax=Halarchaeum grantii TaxID=1193105 RepID=A0A830F8S3_9EURY|nr:PGF-CTERM sorting domain-containing protein [Halarchaeum grantii]GGL30329.1 PGF-CTERM sorting domain-containing protein [Halarchaeum grantii]
MNAERALLGGATALVALSLVAALAVPGALAPPDRDRPPARIAYTEMTVAPTAVAGDTVTLGVTNYVTHDGGPARNVTVLTRAIDLESGFVATSATASLGTLTTGGERAPTATLTVERSGGYRIETVVYENGSRVATGHRSVRGVGALTPAYARSPIRFHEFAGGVIPTVAVAVREAGDERTTLDVAAHVTNTGGESEPVTVEYVARQADSNLVADRASVAVSDVASGHTVTPNATLAVPSDYNYYVDAILRKDGVIVDSTTAAANLDPSRTLSVNETTRDVELDVSDFETEREGGKPSRTTTETSGGTPGFGVPAALAALAGVALLARRWSA